jgi:hypothetical protein
MVLISYYPQFLNPAPAPTPAPAPAAAPGADPSQPGQPPQPPQPQQPAQPQAPTLMTLVDLAVAALGIRLPARALERQRARYKEFMTLQIKTLNLLCWNRGQLRLMLPKREALVGAVVALLRACPGEFAVTRKELLHSMRVLFSLELMREGFLPHVDALLDERVLEGWQEGTGGDDPDGGYSVGSSASSSGRPSDAVRTAALNMLSELVHPLREKLTLPQLGAVIYLFAKQVHDPTLPLTTQMLAVRVMLMMVDSICRASTNDEAQRAGRRLLFWILKTLVTKFNSLRAYAPKFEAQERIRAMEQDLNDQGALRQLSNNSAGSNSGSASRGGSRPVTPANAGTTTGGAAGGSSGASPTGSPASSASASSSGGIGGAGTTTTLPRKPSAAVVERAERVEAGDSLRMVKEMIVTMLRGLKTVIWCLVSPAQAWARARNQPMPERTAPHALSEEEREMLANLFQWGLVCLLRVYSRQAGATAQEAKDVFDLFVGALQVMEAPHLRLAMGRHLELYFNVVLQDSYFLAIAQGLVAAPKEVASVNNSEVAAAVGEALLHFLLRHLHALSGEPAIVDAHANPSVASALDSASPAPRRARPLVVLLPPTGVPPSPSPSSEGQGQGQGEPPKQQQLPQPPPQAVANILFRLFSAAITAVAKYPVNEGIFRPVVKRLVLLCLRYALRARQPQQYYLVLRVLFRVMTGGKLDGLMRELHPLLPQILIGAWGC